MKAIEKKVTITNGLWGTVAFMEGNCMLVLPAPPACSDCKTCPVRRTVRVYEYTMPDQATQQKISEFYDGFSTQLIEEVETDEAGFFQVDIPAGLYTIVVVENGKLYTFGWDQQGGLSSVSFAGGKQKADLTLTYKASF